MVLEMKILVADDDLTSRMMLRAVVAKWNFESVMAEDGTQAWELLQLPQAPSLAILDWMMPGLTGPELCRKLRERREARPLYIILLTSRGERQDVVQGLEAGADDYLAKPYDNQELRARMNVGRRIIELQEALVKREKLQGVLEMAGAVCHELNQPLQVVSGYSELLLMDLPEDDPNRTHLMHIRESVRRIGALTRKIMGITTYCSMDYLQGKGRIVDIEGASGQAQCEEGP
jgi:phosphoserine phosphatase RsbU/P